VGLRLCADAAVGVNPSTRHRVARPKASFVMVYFPSSRIRRSNDALGGNLT
jgi:hypothetical protein